MCVGGGGGGEGGGVDSASTLLPKDLQYDQMPDRAQNVKFNNELLGKNKYQLRSHGGNALL